MKKISVDESLRYVNANSVSLKKMVSKKFEGWRVLLEKKSCGYVKFHPREDAIFKKHVTLDFKISKPYRDRHIGRIALKKAIGISAHEFFVAFLRKSNEESKKALKAVGFQEYDYPENSQMCMFLKK